MPDRPSWRRALSIAVTAGGTARAYPSRVDHSRKWFAALLAATFGGIVVAALLPERLQGATQWATGVAGGLWCLLCAATMVTAATQPRPRRTRIASVGARNLITCGLVVVAAAAVGLGRPAHNRRTSVLPRGLHAFEGNVTSVRRHQRGTLLSAKIESGHRLGRTEPQVPLQAGLRVRLFTDLALDAVPGDLVSVVARLSPRHPHRNFSPAFQPPHRQQVALGRINTQSQVVVRKRLWLRWKLEEVRNHIRAALLETLPPDTAGFALALVLGESGHLREPSRRAFRRAGVAHLLAVSGLHVTLVAGCLLRCLFCVLVAWPGAVARHDCRRLAALLTIPFALLFAALAGGSPSAVRAAVTASLHWGLFAAGRKPEPQMVTLAAVTVLAFAYPEDVLRPGFLLSVLATSAIVTTPHSETLGWLRSALVTSYRTAVATAPVLYAWFASVPSIGVLSNLVLIPAASLIWIPLALVHASCASISKTGLAELTGACFNVATELMLFVCGLFARLELFGELPPPTPWQLAAVSALAFAALWQRGRLRRIVMGLALLLWLSCELLLRVAPRNTDELRVSFLDVGQGDAALISMPNGQHAIIDAGGTVRPRKQSQRSAGIGKRVLVPLFRAQRIRSLALAVLSHAHPDHYGGMNELFQFRTPDELWVSLQAEHEMPDGAVATLLGRVRALGTDVVYPDRACRKPRLFGDVAIRLLAPCPHYDAGYGLNDNSLVAVLEYANLRILFTGDIEQHGEAALLRAHPELRADIVKVPHHGSDTSSGAPLIRQLGPAAAIVSAGRDNLFGHPHPSVLDRYESHSVRVLRTDLDGAIEIRSDGRRTWIRSWRKPDWLPLTAHPALSDKPPKRQSIAP